MLALSDTGRPLWPLSSSSFTREPTVTVPDEELVSSICCRRSYSKYAMSNTGFLFWEGTEWDAVREGVREQRE